jgi:hypothetical protein
VVWCEHGLHAFYNTGVPCNKSAKLQQHCWTGCDSAVRLLRYYRCALSATMIWALVILNILGGGFVTLAVLDRRSRVSRGLALVLLRLRWLDPLSWQFPFRSNRDLAARQYVQFRIHTFKAALIIFIATVVLLDLLALVAVFADELVIRR